MLNRLVLATICGAALIIHHQPSALAETAEPHQEQSETITRGLPKAPPAAIGTPPILTQEGSSIAGSSTPSDPSRSSSSRPKKDD